MNLSLISPIENLYLIQYKESSHTENIIHTEEVEPYLLTHYLGYFKIIIANVLKRAIKNNRGKPS